MNASRLQIWRVDRARFKKTAKTGEGARISGGRWNSPGLPAIYCGWTLELSVLEILVHLSTPAERADPRIWYRITLPRDLVASIPSSRLPRGWNDPMRHHPETIAIGDRFLRANRKPALRVPSAVLEGGWNYILNPRHPLFGKTRWTRPAPLHLDPRLLD